MIEQNKDSVKIASVMKYKVLITTSGVGNRLGEITKFTNKVLVRIGKKPAISHIIDSYKKDTEFVITLGHFGDHVRDYIRIAYPNLRVQFIKVDKFQGEGSSLGYSMLKARKLLNCPFIFHAGDTIVTEKIPIPDHNWNGGYKGNFSSMYASFSVSKNEIQNIQDKGAMHFQYLHVGLVGIKDYKVFWKKLAELYRESPADQTLNDCRVVNQMIDNGFNFSLKEYKSWFDSGNVDGLNKARKEIGGDFYNLDKFNEAIYLLDKHVVKFYSDTDLIEKKIKRADELDGVVPKIESKNSYFFKYKYIDGSLYSEVVDPEDLYKFLKWCYKRLWIKKDVNRNFNKVCKNFYQQKTIQRIEQFLKIHKLEDKAEKINGVSIPSLMKILSSIDFNWLAKGDQTGFHGDLVLDNVIKTKNGYKLIDWRQDFGGLIESGDMYYDLAKINHNLIINHQIVSKELFSLVKKSGNITCDILRSNNLSECQKIFFEFIKEKGLDEKKIKILTCMIWLNSSPLHEDPYGQFLYYFGKYNLWKELNEN